MSERQSRDAIYLIGKVFNIDQNKILGMNRDLFLDSDTNSYKRKYLENVRTMISIDKAGKRLNKYMADDAIQKIDDEMIKLL